MFKGKPKITTTKDKEKFYPLNLKKSAVYTAPGCSFAVVVLGDDVKIPGNKKKMRSEDNFGSTSYMYNDID